MSDRWDCIVIGAGPAGLSAALTLGRACRRVLVIDDQVPRNAAATHSHGLLGHDGIPAPELRARGIDELTHYDVTIRETTLVPAQARVHEDEVVIGEEHARTVIVATGLIEDTPLIDGFDEIYGRSAHTCPYCDGWEHRGQPIAVLAPPAAAPHLGRLLRQWTDDLIVFSDLPAKEEHALAEAGITVEHRRIARFTSTDGQLEAVELDDGSAIARGALFFHVGLRPRAEIDVALGCECNTGGYLTVDEHTRQTTTNRVYAAGNCVNPKHNVPLAIADGVRAAVTLNERLLADDLPGTRTIAADPH